MLRGMMQVLKELKFEETTLGTHYKKTEKGQEIQQIKMGGKLLVFS
ncbi:MAG: hypothetical protein ABII27_00770 [bacterium]